MDPTKAAHCAAFFYPMSVEVLFPLYPQKNKSEDEAENEGRPPTHAFFTASQHANKEVGGQKTACAGRVCTRLHTPAQLGGGLHRYFGERSFFRLSATIPPMFLKRQPQELCSTPPSCAGVCRRVQTRPAQVYGALHRKKEPVK